ncbi:MAG: HAMP domain-containing sensor histidine kinase [Oscillospiraceae bacterium]
MKEGLYKKYITTFVLTLVLCTALLGIALLYFSAQNFTEEKELTLRHSAELARDTVRGGETLNGGSTEFSMETQETLNALSKSAGVTLFVCDEDGTVILCTEKNCTHDAEIGERMLRIATQKGIYVGASFMGSAAVRHGGYMVGLPVRLAGGSMSFVFATSPITPLFSFLVDLLVTFLVSSGVMLVASSFIIYYATKQLAYPLAEISNTAGRFGKGDFSARVAVEGEDEISNLARSFNEMADSLCEFERNRRSFVANVSHELRTPMTTIGGYVDGILDGTIPPDRQEHYLQIVSNEVKRLSRLSSSLLDVSRIEEDEYVATLVSVNAWDVMLSVLWSAERRIVDKNITITEIEASPCNVMCDNDMLYQIFYNLLDNAIKFTPEGGEITITIGSAADRSSETAVVVRNTGAGIPEEDLARIFGRFYKTDKSRSLDRTGTGLGLYIVRSLVKKMNGSVSAASVEGEYAEFTVMLHSAPYDKKDRQKSQKIIFPSGKNFPQQVDALESKDTRSRSKLSRLLGGFKKGR